MTSEDRALSRLRQHRHYDYRACAPHWDDRTVCAADERVPLTVFYGDGDEDQEQRTLREQQAKALCGGCALRTACLEYAIGDGRKLRERHGVFGGMTAPERTVLLKARLANLPELVSPVVPVALLRTVQKQAVLAALAAHEGLEEAVQAAIGQAGMDERAVLWQLSRIATLLGLGRRSRGREDILTAARLAGVLPDTNPNGPVEQAAAPGAEQTGGPIRLPYPRRTDIPGQLQLELGDAARPRLRIVIPARPSRPGRGAETVPLFALDTTVPVLLEAA